MTALNPMSSSVWPNGLSVAALEQPPASNEFCDALHRAFNDADRDGAGQLTMEQWEASSIRRFFRDGQLSDEDFRTYFLRIDANCDGFVDWQELCHYLILEIAATELKMGERSLNFIQKTGKVIATHDCQHRDPVRSIIICHSTGEYVTLSSDSIRFWRITDLNFRGAILAPGLFSAMALFEKTSHMAVATSDRRLLIFDFEKLEQLPAEISASPSGDRIKRMSHWDCASALKVLQTTHLPLYNVPTSMLNAEFCDNAPLQRVFFVADDQGILQVFRFFGPSRRQSVDVRTQRIGRHKVHDAEITQMSAVAVYQCYATSSLDATVKFWEYDIHRDELTVNRTIRDNTPIITFHFSNVHKQLVTASVSRDAYVWSLSPPKRLSKLGGHYNTLLKVTEFVTTTDDHYILTMTNRKEIRLWDAGNYRLAREWIDRDMQRPENRFSAVVFDERFHAIITASGVPCRWSEDAALLASYLERHSHSAGIVGCFYLPPFRQILSLDERGTFSVWDPGTGARAISVEPEWAPDMPSCRVAALDTSGRRAVTGTSDRVVKLWNYNVGLELAQVKLAGDPIMVSAVEYLCIAGREFIAVGGWDRAVTLYTEVIPGEFSVFRKFKDHTSDVTCIAGFREGVVSGTAGGEIMTWKLDTSVHQCEAAIPDGLGAECVVCIDNYAIFGDEGGHIHVFSLPTVQLLSSVEAHGITKEHSITAIAVSATKMFTGDSLGYLRKWRVEDRMTLIPGPLFRGHLAAIRSVVLTPDGNFLVSGGSDMNVRLFFAETCEYIGLFHQCNSWTLEDPTTWAGLPPADVDMSHFTEAKMPVEMIRTIPLGSGKAKAETDNMVRVEIPPLEVPPPPADFGQALSTLEQFFATPTVDMARKLETTHGEILPRPLRPDRPQLALTARPAELLGKVQGLLKDPSRHRRGRGDGGSSTREEACRMPIVTPKQFRPKLWASPRRWSTIDHPS
jgi:WD40 repeat protein